MNLEQDPQTEKHMAEALKLKRQSDSDLSIAVRASIRLSPKLIGQATACNW